MATCQSCRTVYPEKPGKYQCPECGHMNLETPKRQVPTIPIEQVTRTQRRRLPTGYIDKVLGGGLVVTSTILISGDAGAGKSTLSLQIAAAIAELKRKGPILYIAAEEAPEDIAERADRIESAAKGLEFLPALGGLAEDETLEDILDSVGPSLVILDSLPGLCGEDDAKQIETCVTLKTYAADNDCPAIILDHVTKEGDFAGRMTLAHTVDATLSFMGDKDRPERVLTVHKNRFGPAPLSEKYLHTPHGLRRM